MIPRKSWFLVEMKLFEVFVAKEIKAWFIGFWREGKDFLGGSSLG